MRRVTIARLDRAERLGRDMTKAEIKRTINAAFYEAERLCDRYGGLTNHVKESARIASRQERQHRAMGRRMVGDIGERVPVETVAMYFALRGFYTAKRDRSLEHRSDLVTAYGAAERVCCTPEGRKAWQKARRGAKAALALDYSRDMARG